MTFTVKDNQLFRLNQSPPLYLKGTRVSPSGLYKLFPFCSFTQKTHLQAYIHVLIIHPYCLL